jgi:hypothetical protein
MSVQRNQYVGFGFMIDFKEARQTLIDSLGEEGYEEFSDKYSDNAFNDEIVEVHGCSIIEDGMNGDYTFFGKIYAKSEDHSTIDTMELPAVSERDRIITEHEFTRIFGTDYELEPKLYIITHYR